jgi:HipA-like protein
MAAAANDPALIGLGLVLPGATRIVAQGVTETYRGVVEVAGQPLGCHIKFLGIRELFNEALGSVLCKLAGLRTPNAYIVEVRIADYPASAALAAAGGPTAIAFATATVPLEAFVRRVDLAAPDARRAAVEKWADWPEVLTFDQWIRNVDRHLGNFLVGAPGEVYLIDHGLAFGGNSWTAATLPPDPRELMARLWNELLVQNTDAASRVAAAPIVQRFADRLLTIDTAAACILTHLAAMIPDADRTALVAFLAARQQVAAEQVCRMIGVPMLALGVGA